MKFRCDNINFSLAHMSIDELRVELQKRGFTLTEYVEDKLNALKLWETIRLGLLIYVRIK